MANSHIWHFSKSAILLKCNDLFLTNWTRGLHSTCVFEIGLSDFGKLVLTNLQLNSESSPLKKIRYKFWRGKIQKFKNYLSKLSSNDMSADVFKLSFLKALKKYLPAHHFRFIEENLVKYWRHRARLQNKIFKEKRRHYLDYFTASKGMYA